MSSVRSTVKAIAVTTVVVSGAWIIVLALLLDRYAPASSAPVATAAPVAGQKQAGTTGGGATIPRGGGTTYRSPSGPLTIPVVGVRPDQLVDTFTQAREGGVRVHDAIDIMADRGTVVVAAAPGRVEKLFLSERGGITAYIRSADWNTIYYYAHLEAYAPDLREGQAVMAGQPIGTVGSTGNANPDGPHLHFAILQTRAAARWHEGTAINPYPLLAR